MLEKRLRFFMIITRTNLDLLFLQAILNNELLGG